MKINNYFFLDEVQIINSEGDSNLFIPSNENMKIISLNGGLKDDLNWLTECIDAEYNISEGKRILWQINLGLFNDLLMPITEQSQFSALCLAIKHFNETIWKKYKSNSIGVIIYNGKANLFEGIYCDENINKKLQNWLKQLFSSSEHFSSETGIVISDFENIQEINLRENPNNFFLLQLFWRDLAVEYLRSLKSHLNGDITPYVVLHNSNLDPLTFAILISKERYEPIQRILSYPMQKNNVAFCISEKNNFYPKYFNRLKSASSLLKRPHSFIIESCLTNEWSGVDYLIFDSESVTAQGLRKLKGFCAAGGSVVNLGQSLGLPQEIPFSFFIET